MTKVKSKGRQGFASMDREKQRKIASMGGKSQGRHNNRGNFANDVDKARRAGSVGGTKSRRSEGRRKTGYDDEQR
jgi:general stress protein YciG